MASDSVMAQQCPCTAIMSCSASVKLIDVAVPKGIDLQLVLVNYAARRTRR